jgi:molybdopterin synthase sulfur carrier subunit
MATMSLHYWAGARAAAGVAEERFEADTIAAALEAACQSRGSAFRRVVSACSLLVDGLAVHAADLERPRSGAVRVELLPPFAGGFR